jgi:hypothetical protein
MNSRESSGRPLLLVDVDGVLSLFGRGLEPGRDALWLMVDGIVHLLSRTAAAHLRELASLYELAWCTGWEEKANEYLLPVIGLPGPLQSLTFSPTVRQGAHWKLAAIDGFAGPDRPLAWIDDSLTDDCRAWAAARPGPTLIVATDPVRGLTAPEAALLRDWAAGPRRLA